MLWGKSFFLLTKCLLISQKFFISLNLLYLKNIHLKVFVLNKDYGQQKTACEKVYMVK
jgi:hypothetical protein